MNLGAEKRHLQVAPNSRGRLSDPSYRFERLHHKAPGFAGGYLPKREGVVNSHS